MAYQTHWLSLKDALDCVIATGLGEQEAMRDICNAVADSTIEVRVQVDPSDLDYPGTVLPKRNVHVPQVLSPADLNWAHSRPVRPWSTGPAGGEHYSDLRSWKPRLIALLQLRREDLNAVLLNASAQNGPGLAEPPTSKPEPGDVDVPSASRIAARQVETAPIPNKPGGGGQKKQTAINAMIDAVTGGTVTFEKLRRMRQKELSGIYSGAGRTVLVAARKDALHQLAEKGYSDGEPT